MIGLPGAVTSGFRKLSPLRGPPDENVAVPVGCVRAVGDRDRHGVARNDPRAVGSRGRDETLDAEERDGHVVERRPYRGSGRSRFRTAAATVLLLTMITAAAPACWP